MLKYLQQPINNFERNMNKAKALVFIFEALDNLSKGKYNRPIEKFQQITQDRSESIGTNVIKQIEKQVKMDEKIKKQVEKKGEDLVKLIDKYKDGIERFFNSVKLAKEEILLEQALVLTISAMEVFLKDSVIILINRNHKLHEKFEREIKSRLDYLILKEYKYNFEKNIGQIIFDEKTFFKINDIKDIYKRILNKKNIFQNAKIRNGIHKYIEIRHLIVHRNSKIDKQFIQRTGIRKKIGAKYVLTSKEVIEAINTVELLVQHIYQLIKKSK